MDSGTTKAGDPSGKDETRLILTPEKIDENKRSMLSGVQHLLKFGDGPSDAMLIDNAGMARTSSNTSRSCAMSGGIFPSIAC